MEVTWQGLTDDGGRHLRPFGGRPMPIEEYEGAVAWAVSMAADQMVHPLYVRPMTERERDASETIVVTTPPNGMLAGFSSPAWEH